MRTEELPVSVLQHALVALFRGLCIIAGGAVAAYLLGAAIDADRSPGAGGYPTFWGFLGDAITPDAAVTEALGKTMVLGAAAVLLGTVIGAATGGLLRLVRLGRVLGHVSVPVLALAVPGVALYPIAHFAAGRDLAPLYAVGFDESAGDGLRFVVLWGALVGLSIAPVVAAAVAAGGRHPTVPGPAQALAAARPEAATMWRFGFPSTAFLLALATAELLSRQRGVFPLLYESLVSNRLGVALTLVFWVAVAGAVLAVVIDLVGRLWVDRSSDEGPALLAPTRPAIPLLVGIGVFLLVAVVGRLISEPYAVGVADRLVAPTLGGPWLGSDRLGRSLLSATAAALGPGLVTALLSALVAIAAGMIVALLVRIAGPSVGRFLEPGVDLLWWPTAMILPMVVLAFGGLDRRELDPAVILFTGVMLVPLASRLLAPMVLVADQGRTVRTVAAWLYCSAIALSIHLLLGFAGFDGSTSRPSLGALVADGVQSYEAGPWPFLVPALAGALVLALFYGLAGSMIAGDRAPSGVSGVAAGKDEVEPEPGPALTADAPAGHHPPVGPPDGRRPAPTAADDAADHSDRETIDQQPLPQPAGEAGGGSIADVEPPVAPVEQEAADGPRTSDGQWVATAQDDAPALNGDEAAPLTAAADAPELPSIELPSTELPAPELPSIELPATEHPGRDAGPADGEVVTVDLEKLGTAEQVVIDLGRPVLEPEQPTDDPAQGDDRSGPGLEPGGDGEPAGTTVEEKGEDPATQRGTERGADPDDEPAKSAMERQATRTVELRPSALRRAGIAVPTSLRSPVELSTGWSRPVLASRPPAPTTPDQDDDQPEIDPPDR